MTVTWPPLSPINFPAPLHLFPLTAFRFGPPLTLMPSSYDSQTIPMYDGRLVVRSRPRRLMFLLFAAAFATIILFSRYPSLSDPMGSSLGLYSPSLVTVEPVTFALIMFSESSATEGAILLKVSFAFYPSFRMQVRSPTNEFKKNSI